MKKLLAIFMLCFAFFAAKAQYNFLYQESFDDGLLPTGWVIIDADGDGYNWIVDNSTSIVDHTGGGSIYSESYNLDASAALTPDNYLITCAYTIPADANLPTLSWWAVGQDPDYAEEHYAVYISTTGQTVADFTSAAIYEGYSTEEWVNHTFDLSAYVGQTIYVAFRHYNSTDVFYLNLDDIEIYTVTTDPTLITTPEAMNFGTVIAGDSAVRPATVTAYNLTAGITVTTTAPFSVSLNDTTYATSVTMPATGGTLYVKYAPTAAGTDSAIVVLASGDVADTIVVLGRGFECTTLAVPFVEDFDAYEGELPVCYQFVYGNNDPTVNPILAEEDDDDNYVVAFNSMSRTDVYDQYMISPMMQYTGTNPLRLSVKARPDYSDETFRLGYSTTTDSLNAFTWGDEETAEDDEVYETFSMVIPSNAKYVAIHYTSNYKYYLYIDSLSVEVITLPQIMAGTTDVDFGYVEVNNTSDDMIIPVTGLLLEDAITATITTTSPFEISVNGVDYGATATLPTEGDTLYVHYTPTAVGADTAVIMLSSLTELADTVYVTLTGKGYECDNNLPYQTNFTDEAKNLCWTIVDANEDEYTFEFDTEYGYASYRYNYYSNADDWLTSPAFNLTGAEYVAFDYKVYSSNYIEKFEVYIIGTDSTVIVPEMEATNTDYMTQMIDLSDYTGSYRIAFHCTSDTNRWRLYFTNFVIDSIANLESSLTVNPDSIDFGSAIFTEGYTASETAVVTAVVISDSLTVTTAAPFAVSLDGTNYADSLIIPANDSALSYTTTLYVQYAPAAPGTHTGTVTISGDSLTATIGLSAESVDCSGAATLPFTEDFEDELAVCWQNIDKDGDEFPWEFFYGDEDYEEYAHNGYGLAVSRSWFSYGGYFEYDLTPDNWLRLF